MEVWPWRRQFDLGQLYDPWCKQPLRVTHSWKIEISTWRHHLLIYLWANRLKFTLDYPTLVFLFFSNLYLPHARRSFSYFTRVLGSYYTKPQKIVRVVTPRMGIEIRYTLGNQHTYHYTDNVVLLHYVLSRLVWATLIITNYPQQWA